MCSRHVLEVLTLVLLCCVTFCKGSREFEFESDISSWPRLKRQTGYRTESGRYRGGLYKNARDQEQEWYHCLRDNNRFCTLWSTQEAGGGETEQGQCFCRQERGRYCLTWTCSQIEIGFEHCNDDVCEPTVQGETTNCVCDKASRNEKYCEEWSCVERGTDGALEDEYYRCLQEDESGKYCFRWKGDINSSKEVESSVCQCDLSTTDRFCETWECIERGLVRCSKHSGAWCNFWAALFAGGGVGLLFLVAGGALFVACVALGGEPPEACAIYVCGLILGLPWIAAVAIWGGDRAWRYVVPVWVVAIVAPCFVLKLLLHLQSTRIKQPTKQQPPVVHFAGQLAQFST